MNNSQLFQGIEFLKNLSLFEFFLFFVYLAAAFFRCKLCQTSTLIVSVSY